MITLLGRYLPHISFKLSFASRVSANTNQSCRLGTRGLIPYSLSICTLILGLFSASHMNACPSHYVTFNTQLLPQRCRPAVGVGCSGPSPVAAVIKPSVTEHVLTATLSDLRHFTVARRAFNAVASRFCHPQKSTCAAWLRCDWAPAPTALSTGLAGWHRSTREHRVPGAERRQTDGIRAARCGQDRSSAGGGGGGGGPRAGAPVSKPARPLHFQPWAAHDG